MNDKIILGLWPIAGITSGPTSVADNRATIRAAYDAGVRCFDTAFSYGYEGESDSLLGDFLAELNSRSASERASCGVIGKVGQRWTVDRQRQIDCSPQTLRVDAETSLRRLRVERFDLLMLHAVDPQVDIRTSAEAIADLQHRGLANQIGVCNVTVDQLDAFNQAARADAIQIPLNLLQRDNLSDLIPHCFRHGIHVHVYWTLMKGILAGKIGEDHQFGHGDSRPKYEIYQGTYRARTHRIVQQLAAAGAECGLSVAELSIGWAISQPGVTAAIVGAKHPGQIVETASAQRLSKEVLARVESVVHS